MYFAYAPDAELFLAVCERAGVARERVLREAQLNSALIDPPALHVPWPAMACLLEAAERLVGDPYLGLHIDPSAVARHYGLVGQYIIRQRTLQEAIRQSWNRWSNLLTNTFDFEFVGQGDLTAHRLRWRLHDAPALRHLADSYLVSSLTGNRVMIGPSWRPVKLHLHHRTVPLEEYERVLGCSPVASADADEMHVESALLDVPQASYVPELLDLLRPAFESFLVALKSDLEATLWVRGQLSRGLHDGYVPTLAALAKLLSLSPRTLQSRLRAEGTSFREVLDNARRELAIVALFGATEKLDAIAARLGFSDAAAFAHAFRRWTGMTPAEWRKTRSLSLPS